MTSMLWLLHVATSCLHRLYVPHGVTKAMSCDESPPGGPNSSRRRERNSCGRLRAGRFCRKLGRTWHVAGRLCQGLHLPSSSFCILLLDLPSNGFYHWTDIPFILDETLHHFFLHCKIPRLILAVSQEEIQLLQIVQRHHQGF